MRRFGYAITAVIAAGAVDDRAADAPRSPAPSYLNEVVPLLTKTGCNQGACHGKGAGQNGFRLSLRGYAPGQDSRPPTAAERGTVKGMLKDAPREEEYRDLFWALLNSKEFLFNR